MADERTMGAVDAPAGGDAERAIQDRLAHAIERAQVGEDRELAHEVRERGEQLANLLYGLLRTSRLYAAENKAFDSPVTELASCVARLTNRLGPVTIVCVQDQVYVNDVRVRFGEKTGKPGELGVELSKHNVGGVTFQAPPSDADIRAMIGGFAQPPDPASPRAALTRWLDKAGVRGIELGGINRFPKVGEKAGEAGAEGAREVVERADEVIGAVWRNAAAGHMINALALRRTVAELLEHGTDDDAIWRMDQEAPPHVAHAVRVNLVALTIGQAAGLPESVLQDLGVAAILHDVGYTSTVELAPGAPHVVSHPLLGARMLAVRRGFHEAKVRRVLATLHHHRDYDDARGRPSLFGRIVRIAEDFDNYCRPTGGGLSPAEAIVAMTAGSGTRYDPVLLQLLVNRMGRFPPGTLIELEDGRVVETTSLVDVPARFATPRARVRLMPDGRPPRGEVIVDLASEGRPRRLLRELE